MAEASADVSSGAPAHGSDATAAAPGPMTTATNDASAAGSAAPSMQPVPILCPACPPADQVLARAGPSARPTDTVQWIQCSRAACKQWYHAHCQGVDDPTRFLRWYCTPCIDASVAAAAAAGAGAASQSTAPSSSQGFDGADEGSQGGPAASGGKRRAVVLQNKERVAPTRRTGRVRARVDYAAVEQGRPPNSIERWQALLERTERIRPDSYARMHGAEWRMRWIAEDARAFQEPVLVPSCRRRAVEQKKRQQLEDRKAALRAKRAARQQKRDEWDEEHPKERWPKELDSATDSESEDELTVSRIRLRDFEAEDIQALPLHDIPGQSGPSSSQQAQTKSSARTTEAEGDAGADDSRGSSKREIVPGSSPVPEALAPASPSPSPVAVGSASQASSSAGKARRKPEPVPTSIPGMAVPPPDMTIWDIADVLGHDTPIEVIDVESQTSSYSAKDATEASASAGSAGAGEQPEASKAPAPPAPAAGPGRRAAWDLAAWARYFHAPAASRRKVLNVISLEVSGTPMARFVRAPRLVRQLDWVTRDWPKDKIAGEDGEEGREATMKGADGSTWPKVQRYVLMGVQGAYTDFHIDFAASSVYYHVIFGQKTFLFAPPTARNLRRYRDWSMSTQQDVEWLGKDLDQVTRVDVFAGDTLLIPSGWIHAVWTPVDSLVVGGNFLHDLGAAMQLRLVRIENESMVQRKAKFPHLRRLLWYVAQNWTARLQGRKAGNARDSGDEEQRDAAASAAATVPPVGRIASGLRQVVQSLEADLELLDEAAAGTAKSPHGPAALKRELKAVKEGVPHELARNAYEPARKLLAQLDRLLAKTERSANAEAEGEAEEPSRANGKGKKKAPVKRKSEAPASSDADSPRGAAKRSKGAGGAQGKGQSGSFAGARRESDAPEVICLDDHPDLAPRHRGEVIEETCSESSVIICEPPPGHANAARGTTSL